MNKFFVADLHNDLITERDFEFSKKHLSKNRDYLTSVVLAVWTTKTDYNNYKSISSLINKYKNISTDISLMFGIEDASCIDEKDYHLLSNNDFAYVSLTWNYDNCLGGGAFGESGLSKQGRTLLNFLYKNGIVLDLAHANQKTFWDIIDMYDGKMICSHTCFDWIRPHKRNITIEQTKVLVDRDALIGLAFVNDFLKEGEKAEVGDIIRHIDSFVQKFGCDNLAFGTDFFGTQNLPKNIDDNYSSLAILVEKLQAIGYNEAVIKKIFFENFYRAFEVKDGRSL